MNRKIIGRLGTIVILCLAGFVYLFFLVGSVYEAVVFPKSPQQVPLARAVAMDLQNKPDFLVFDKARFVSITDAVWECASVKQSGYRTIFIDKRRTDAVFTDTDGTAVVFVQVDGFYSCQELQGMAISGELQRIDERPVEYQGDRSGAVVIEDPKKLVFRFCTHCTPSQAVSLPIFWILLPFVIWWLRKRWKTASL